MALTKVSGSIIDQPFDVGIITATNFRSGVATVGTMHVTGNLQVDGTTTTLDTIVTEVDRLEVSANNSTVGLAVTQSGSGDILNLYDGASEVFSVADGGGVTITDSIIHAGDPNTKIRFPTNDTVTIETGGTEAFKVRTDQRVQITSGSAEIIGAEGASAQLRLTADEGDDGADYWRFESNHSTNKLNIATWITGAWVDKVTMTTDGNFGIGTTNPSEQLVVSNGGAEGFEVTAGVASNINKIVNYNRSGGSYSSLRIDAAEHIFRIGSSEKLRITSGGNVGIGTDNPDKKLEVAVGNSVSDGILVKGNSSPLIQINEGSGVSANFGLDGNGSYFGPTSNHYQVFRTNNVERLRITSAGSVGINTTSPTSIFDVETGTGSGINFDNSGANAPTINFMAGAARIESAAQILVGENNGGGDFLIKTKNTSGTLTTRVTVNNSGLVRVPDNGKFTAGAGDDLQIFHNGSANVMQSINGNISLQVPQGSEIQLSQGGSFEHGIRFIAGGSVQLYHNNSKKLETTTTGVTVTGSLTQTTEYPSIRPTLDLNFAATKTLDRRITFTRDSIGTFTDDMGIIRYASNNVPRFDHDGATGESLGLLIEESRTNYCRSSVDLSSSTWQGTGSYGIDNAITNPDGSVGAYYHTGLELYHYPMDLSGASTNVITVSTWVKERSGQSGNLDIEIFQQISGSAISMGVWSFNPTTKAISTAPSTYSDGRVQEYPNGWYRVSAKATTASGNFSSTTRIDFQNNEHYVWGTQVEVGSFPTSYIPTNGSTVTRAADIAKITGTNFTDFYNQDEGTITTSTNSLNTSSTQYPLVIEGDVSNNERHLFAESSAYQYQIKDGGTTTAQIDAGQINPSKNIIAAAYKLNDAAVSLNGSNVATDTSATMPTCNILKLGHWSTTNYSGHLMQVKYYNKRLPNAQLQGLTQQ